MVLFDWEGEHAGELSLIEGEYIKLTKWINPEWLEGEFEGKHGQFPAAFVDVIEDVTFQLTIQNCKS